MNVDIYNENHRFENSSYAPAEPYVTRISFCTQKKNAFNRPIKDNYLFQ